MWRTFVVPVLHKQAGLIRNSTGCCTSRVYSVHLTGNECRSDGSNAKQNVTKQHDITNKNLAKAQNTVVGLLLKLHDGPNGKLTYNKAETQFPFIQSLLDHISRHTSLAEESRQNSELTTCTPRTRKNGKESGFGFKNICMGFEKWCYGVVVVSSLISWHRLLFKNERKHGSKNLNIWNIYDVVNVDGPLRVLPVNGPAKPVDPLDAACSSLESAMADCMAVTENALAIRFSTLKLHEKALTFFQSASQRGNIAAHFNMGLCYEKGLGTTPDISKAVISYKLAASHGHLNAAYNLGMILLQGKHTGEKTIDGVKMMEKAAKGGLTKAQTFLGLYYADDDNEHYDMKKSVHWLQMASEHNDSKAQYHLGICYEKGLGVARNMQKAREMYGRAAENGHSAAQYNYAVFHENGMGGLCIDRHEALRWYNTAAENGNYNAQNNLEYLQKELAAGKGNPNILGRLFADVWVSKQPAGSGGIMPRCSSSPDRLFMQSDLNSTECLQGTRSGEQKNIAYEDSKCVWVI